MARVSRMAGSGRFARSGAVGTPGTTIKDGVFGVVRESCPKGTEEPDEILRKLQSLSPDEDSVDVVGNLNADDVSSPKVKLRAELPQGSGRRIRGVWRRRNENPTKQSHRVSVSL